MSAVAKTFSRDGHAGANALPVIEIFGPTVQGEGPDAGRPAYFVRFGGCDYRCSWCDSMYAVEPSEVRSHAERLTSDDIRRRLAELNAGPRLVVLSGGNPALLELGELVAVLHRVGHEVAVETQGSRWRAWLGGVDHLVVSPKPPSSGMAGLPQAEEFENFMTAASASGVGTALKIVVFGEDDVDWAQDVHRRYPALPFYLSVGTDVGLDDATTTANLRSRYQWLAATVSRRTELSDARVLPQLHVIAWGTARGV